MNHDEQFLLDLKALLHAVETGRAHLEMKKCVRDLENPDMYEGMRNMRPNTIERHIFKFEISVLGFELPKILPTKEV